MKEYHKIKTVFSRDPDTNFRTLLIGEWAIPEFEYLALNKWVFTEKVDGTNIRIMWNEEKRELNFGGKTQSFFSAVPSETEPQREERIKMEVEEKRLSEIERLKSEINERTKKLSELEQKV